MDSVSGTVTFNPPARKPAAQPIPETIVQLDTLSRHVHHIHYQCPVYCWLAEGKVKFHKIFIEPRTFLYMEYRDRLNTCRYRQLQFLSLEEALIFLDQEAAQTVLPNIDGNATASRPVRLPDQSQAA